MRIELKIFLQNGKIEENVERWKKHAERLDGICIPKQTMTYEVYDKRDLGRWRKICKKAINETGRC
jgi:hypothetical protein